MVLMVIEWDIFESFEFFLVLYTMIIIDNQYGRTALIAAAQQGHEPVVAILLVNKADVNTADNVSY